MSRSTQCEITNTQDMSRSTQCEITNTQGMSRSTQCEITNTQGMSRTTRFEITNNQDVFRSTPGETATRAVLHLPLAAVFPCDAGPGHQEPDHHEAQHRVPPLYPCRLSFCLAVHLAVLLSRFLSVWLSVLSRFLPFWRSLRLTF